MIQYVKCTFFVIRMIYIKNMRFQVWQRTTDLKSKLYAMVDKNHEPCY